MRRGPRSLQGVLVYIYKDYKFQRIQTRSVSPLRLLTLKIFDSLLHGGSPGFSTKNSNNIIIWHAVDNGKRENALIFPSLQPSYDTKKQFGGEKDFDLHKEEHP